MPPNHYAMRTFSKFLDSPVYATCYDYLILHLITLTLLGEMCTKFWLENLKGKITWKTKT
jgi:hypothetical protein